MQVKIISYITFTLIVIVIYEDWSTDYLNDEIHGKLNGLNLNSCLGYTSNIYHQKPILVQVRAKEVHIIFNFILKHHS